MWSSGIRETGSETMKQEYESFMRITPCTTCKGQQTEERILGSYGVADKNIYEITEFINRKSERVSFG